MPQVSVIIPTYNSAQYLKQAVDSVLAQTYRDFEILVVDDGSTDDTENLMKGYGAPVRYIRQSNGGVAKARNRGIEESRGEYVAFLDADDTWLPNKLARQMTALRESPQYHVSYSAFILVGPDLKPLSTSYSKRCGTVLEDLLLRGNVVGSICTIVCERSLLSITGGFDPTLSQCADWDLSVRLAALSDFLYIDEPLVTYRQHGTNMSHNVPLLEKDSIRVLEKGYEMNELPQYLRAKRAKAFARNYMVLAGSYYQARNYRDFLRCAMTAVRMDINQSRYLLTYPTRLASKLFWANH